MKSRSKIVRRIFDHPIKVGIMKGLRRFIYYYVRVRLNM